ncbi:hypothetical protein [Pontibacter pamirensis]|uniref:hypothetical protein n=1 Tax=Pontibacter pamirensis TaxID=2562824 RepID=UPI00138A04BE|nr:hypothetical protein [Pontibacter pamirensis]
MADFLLKYRGLSLGFEHLSGRADGTPVTRNEDGEESYVYVGRGQNWQLGYVFRSEWGVAGRYARLSPGKGIRAKAGPAEELTLGVSKYIKGHRLKIQSDLTQRTQLSAGGAPGGRDRHLLLRLQLEVGL